MKSLTNAIIGVTSGVAAFVVLDLLRHHGVEMTSIERDRATLLATAVEEGVGEGATGEAAAGDVDDGVEKAVDAQALASADRLVTASEASRPTPIDLEDAVVEEIVEIGDSRAAVPVPHQALPPVTESAPSDLARAGERAKALAAAMERLGKRLDGTANRKFP